MQKKQIWIFIHPRCILLVIRTHRSKLKRWHWDNVKLHLIYTLTMLWNTGSSVLMQWCSGWAVCSCSCSCSNSRRCNIFIGYKPYGRISDTKTDNIMHMLSSAVVAQHVEHLPQNLKVVWLSPTWDRIFLRLGRYIDIFDTYWCIKLINIISKWLAFSICISICKNEEF